MSQFLHKIPKDLKYHIAKKQSAPKLDNTFNCKLCSQDLLGFYALRQHENTQHGFPIKTTNVDPDDIINEVDDANLKVELRSFQDFLVDSELQRVGHKVFNYAVEKLNEIIVNEKLDLPFNNLKCAAKKSGFWVLFEK